MMKRKVSKKTEFLKEEGRNNSEKSKFSLFTLEFFGNILIVTSGVIPFIHVLIPDDRNGENVFGFDNLHVFMYSLGNHAALFLLTVGILLVATLPQNNSRLEGTQFWLRLTLISPFISALFFMSWVFIPDVNFDIITYIVLGVTITILSILILLRVYKYLNNIKQLTQHRELIVEQGLDYINTTLENRQNEEQI